MFSLDVYTNFKIKHHCEYSVNSPDYDDWLTRADDEEFTMCGAEFANIIGGDLKDTYFSDCRFDEKKIYITKFDPTTGWVCHDIYEFEEVQNDK